MNYKRVFLLVVFIACTVFTVVAQQDTVPEIKERLYTNLNVALKAHPDSVTRLKLVRKRLKNFPVEILQFKNLRELDISNNRIRKIPAEISKLKKLEKLDVSKNKIVELPTTIGELEKLWELKANRNRLQLLPSEIGKLVNMQTLDLWDNDLETLPESLKNLQNLKVLELRGILFNQEQQDYIISLVPWATIHLSPPCICN